MKKLKTQSKAAPSRRRQSNGGSAGADFRKMATELAAAGRAFYARGWALGTSGNFSAVLSRSHAANGGIALEGYEMLKGLEGVRTHKHREWLPILENSQDMTELATRVSATLRESRDIHGFLLREHGLYTWGSDLQETKRHVEILEFLMEVLVRAGAAATR